MTFLEEFEDLLQRNDILKYGDACYVACSGGPDSVALFHLILSLKKKWKLRVGLIHLDHGLRGKTSKRDASFVRGLAKKHRVSFVSETLTRAALKKEPRLSLEEAARIARYDFFCRSAKKRKIKKILLAHTLDDQAETILTRMLQGTGLRGLMGIRQKMKMENVLFLRPLLNFSKKQLMNYIKSNKLTYCQDETNEQKRFRRNWLRLELLPQIEEEFNPRVHEALARIPSILHDDNHLLEQLETLAWKKVFKSKRGGCVTLKRRALLREHPSLQFRILNKALRLVHSKSGLSFEAWQRLRPNLVDKDHRCSLPKNIDFALSYSYIKIYGK